jgi:hypothetical protein
MLDTLGRLSADDLPLDADVVSDVRRFFATWTGDLLSPGSRD